MAVEHTITHKKIRNPEKGASARGALRKFVANRARQICAKLPVSRFVHQRKGAQNRRKFVANLKVKSAPSIAVEHTITHKKIGKV